MYYKPELEIINKFYDMLNTVIDEHEWISNDAVFCMKDIYVGYRTQYGNIIDEKINPNSEEGIKTINHYLGKMFEHKVPLYFRYDVCTKFFTLSFNHHIMTEIPPYGAMPTKILDILNHINDNDKMKNGHFHQLVEIALFQTHKPDMNIFNNVVDAIKTTYENLPILASAGFMFEKDYDEFNWQIVEKTANKLEDMRFVEINKLTGSEESIDMIYYHRPDMFKNLNVSIRDKENPRLRHRTDSIER